MSLFRTLILALTGVAALASPLVPASAQRVGGGDGPSGMMPRPHGDQDRAYALTQRGRSMPLPMIERRVLPAMPGADYLGPEFNGNSYRLKFMRDGRVIWVDVDAATGRIIGKSGD
ncbi:hypothetical protein ABDK56_11580 [Sphingomonas sp. ASV193]|uniref:hypothetical protein n=1 Tax=Sphingomonas sp. ASV193 TaxID=3144405 RepID=UPI0032E8FC1A